MIPLFAIGVFTGFTLSQTGLVVHWWRTRPPRWRYRSTINAVGALVTALATIVFLISKFTQGAWIVVVAIPAFVALFLRIKAYYQRAGVELGLNDVPAKPVARKVQVIVPVSNVSRLTRIAMAEAMSLSSDVVAVSVAVQQVQDERDYSGDLQQQWASWNPGPPLEVLHTEFSSIVDPIVEYIERARERADVQIVVLIPTVLPRHWRYRLLHNQLDLVLSAALHRYPDVVVARVQMPLDVPTH
jgi:hypothetical protein